MFDIWGFLIQTLTVSGVAVLLLVIKALFKDKLPPKWHFAVWGILGIMMLVPAGFHGRYSLFRWPLVVEVIKSWVGEYSFTQVLFPVPMPTAMPKTIAQWIFVGYSVGVVVHGIKYLASYMRIRSVLRNGIAPDDDLILRIQQIAAAQKVKVGRVIAVGGLPSAFVCGMVRPILVVPAEGDIDDKVILHELLHMKHKDTFWSMTICLLRCLHWCNPLVIYCANQALNDMEARCDQHVLEQIEGEERREYGQILLSMANDRFAKTPGSTCINNGGNNIRKRIESIARFKRYPVGMGLVSVCAIILLSLSLVVGVQATDVYASTGNEVWLPLASARSTPCTTPAGAFDTYAKAVLGHNSFCRVMCAPESMQEGIIDEIKESEKEGIYPRWESGLSEWLDTPNYYIYNLKPCDANAYEGLLVIKVDYSSDGQPVEDGNMYLAVQNLKAQKEKGRWVIVPLEGFRYVEVTEQNLEWGCLELPGIVYAGTHSEFRIETKVQTVYTVDNGIQDDNTHLIFGANVAYFDFTPKPHTVFTSGTRMQSESLTHLGRAEDREKIEELGLSVAPVYAGEKRPENLTAVTGYDSGGGSSNGEGWSSQRTEPGWGPVITLNNGGGGTFDPQTESVLPEYYVADLYVNDKLVAQLDLFVQEGVEE